MRWSIGSPLWPARLTDRSHVPEAVTSPASPGRPFGGPAPGQRRPLVVSGARRLRRCAGPCRGELGPRQGLPAHGEKMLA